MITCKEFAELLLEFCEGELCVEYRELICQHTSSCPHCHNYLESYRITMQLCRGLPRTSMPDRLLDKLRAALRDLPENC